MGTTFLLGVPKQLLSSQDSLALLQNKQHYVIKLKIIMLCHVNGV